LLLPRLLHLLRRARMRRRGRPRHVNHEPPLRRCLGRHARQRPVFARLVRCEWWTEEQESRRACVSRRQRVNVTVTLLSSPRAGARVTHACTLARMHACTRQRSILTGRELDADIGGASKRARQRERARETQTNRQIVRQRARAHTGGPRARREAAAVAPSPAASRAPDLAAASGSNTANR